MSASFADRLEPAPKGGGFSMDGWVIWGTSVVRGTDGKYHAFAARWDEDLDWECWQTNSHIVRGTADVPEGPFEFRDVVVPQGPEAAWDRMAHNPSIVRAADGTFLLYYYGSQFDGPLPTAGAPDGTVWTDGSIGLATADAVAGPWEFHGPVHDGTNPVPVVHENGSVEVFTRDHDFEMSVYAADHWSQIEGYELQAESVFAPIEDHYVWRSSADRYHLVAKDMQIHHDSHSGYGPSYAGIHATSNDGTDWTVSDPPPAYPTGSSETDNWSSSGTTAPRRPSRTLNGHKCSSRMGKRPVSTLPWSNLGRRAAKIAN